MRAVGSSVTSVVVKQCGQYGVKTSENDFIVSKAGVAGYNGFLEAIHNFVTSERRSINSRIEAMDEDSGQSLPEAHRDEKLALRCAIYSYAPNSDNMQLPCNASPGVVRANDNQCIYVVNARIKTAEGPVNWDDYLEFNREVRDEARQYTLRIQCVPSECSKEAVLELWEAHFVILCSSTLWNRGLQYAVGSPEQAAAVGDDDNLIWVYGTATQFATRCYRPKTPGSVGTPTASPSAAGGSLFCFHRKGECNKPSIGDTGETLDTGHFLEEMILNLRSFSISNGRRKWENVRTDEGTESKVIPEVTAEELAPCEPIGRVVCRKPAYGYGAAMATSSRPDCALAREVLERAIKQARKNAWSVSCPQLTEDNKYPCETKVVAKDTKFELRFALELPESYAKGDNGQVFHFGLAQVELECLVASDLLPPDVYERTPTPPDTGGGGTPTPPDGGGGQGGERGGTFGGGVLLSVIGGGLASVEQFGSSITDGQYLTETHGESMASVAGVTGSGTSRHAGTPAAQITESDGTGQVGPKKRPSKVSSEHRDEAADGEEQE